MVAEGAPAVKRSCMMHFDALLKEPKGSRETSRPPTNHETDLTR